MNINNGGDNGEVITHSQGHYKTASKCNKCMIQGHTVIHSFTFQTFGYLCDNPLTVESNIDGADFTVAIIAIQLCLR